MRPAKKDNRANGREPGTAREWHIYHVYEDPDFVSECASLQKLKIKSSTYRKKLSAIAEYFDIQQFFINRYLQGDLDIAGNMWQSSLPLVSVGTSGEDEWQFINVTFHPHVTQETYRQAWKEVARAKRKIGETERRRGPTNHKLLYAIFKARKTLPFKQVFELYQAGKLPGYHGRSDQYPDLWAFKAYYYLYHPRKKSST